MILSNAVCLLYVNKTSYLFTYLMLVQFNDPNFFLFYWMTWAWPDDVMMPGQNGDKGQKNETKFPLWSTRRYDSGQLGNSCNTREQLTVILQGSCELLVVHKLPLHLICVDCCMEASWLQKTLWNRNNLE